MKDSEQGEHGWNMDGWIHEWMRQKWMDKQVNDDLWKDDENVVKYR